MALGALGAVGAVGAVDSVGAVGAVGAVDAVGAVGAVDAVGAVGDEASTAESERASVRSGAATLPWRLLNPLSWEEHRTGTSSATRRCQNASISCFVRPQRL